METDSPATIVAFICNWAPYRCFMDASGKAPFMLRRIYPVKVPCAGRIDPAMILSAFERGADGVLIAGCREPSCRFGPGYPSSRKTWETTARLMKTLGIETERFRALYFESHETDRFLSEMEDLVRTISGLKASPWAA